MYTRTTLTGLLVGTALIAMSMSAPAQTAGDDHSAHHPEAEATAPEGNAAGVDSSAMPQGMSGMMEMMTPEMMRMMGEGGMPGMMGQGMMDRGTSGSGMMGMHDMPMGPMMRGPQGHMGGYALGPGVIYGMPHGAPVEMTPARVESFLGHLLERHGNPRLEIGEITEGEDGSIIAEVVTVDGSLVQRLAFNRYPGLFRQID